MGNIFRNVYIVFRASPSQLCGACRQLSIIGILTLLAVGDVVGYATLDENDNVLTNYEIDNNNPFMETRCKSVDILKPTLKPVVSAVKQEEIIIVDESDFEKLVLPTIPSTFDGIYVVKDVERPEVPGPVFNEIQQVPTNRVIFPIFPDSKFLSHFNQ